VEFRVVLRRGTFSVAQGSVRSRLTGSGVEISVDRAVDGACLEARVRIAKGYGGRHDGKSVLAVSGCSKSSKG
jgi:hypothetical protein